MISAAATESPAISSERASVVRSMWACYRLSLHRLFWSRMMVANFVLAAIPVIIAFLIGINQPMAGSVAASHTFYEMFLRIVFLHFMVFFTANLLGFTILRQDVEEQTLHYLFLQPIPRWAILAGKFLAFLTTTSILCVVSLWLTYLLITLLWFDLRAVVTDLFAAGRFMILMRESGVIVLGLAAYGSIAMLMGSIFKSGAYALLLLLWESGLPYLPSAVKLWSIMHYLHSLLPERPSQGQRMFELLGEPATATQCLLTLGIVSAICLGLSLVMFRFKECMYGET